MTQEQIESRRRYFATYSIPRLIQTTPRLLPDIVDICLLFGCEALLFDAVGACGTVGADGVVRVW